MRRSEGPAARTSRRGLAGCRRPPARCRQSGVVGTRAAPGPARDFMSAWPDVHPTLPCPPALTVPSALPSHPLPSASCTELFPCRFSVLLLCS